MTIFAAVCMLGPAFAGPADDALDLAESLRAKGDLQGALKAATDGLNAVPGDYQLSLMAGDIYYDLGQYQDALYFYKRVLENKAKDPGALYGAGSSALKLGLFQEAAGYFEKGINTKKKKAQFQYGLGMSLMELGNYAEADLNIRKAIDKDGKEPLYHIALGEVNYRNKVFSIAISEFNKAIEMDSTMEKAYPDIHYKIAESYLQLRDLDNAIKEYRKNIELHPADTTAWLKLAHISQLSEKYTDAAFCFEKYLEIVPGDGERWFSLGELYVRLRDQDKAAQSFEKAITLKAREAESYGHLANIYSDKKEYEKAWDSYTRYEKTFGPPDSVLYWFDKGKVALKLGAKDNAFFDSALASFQKVAGLDSTYSSAYEYAGLSMYYKKDYATAVPYFVKKIALDSTSVNSYRNLAFCYLKIESYDKAAGTFEKALALKPEDSQMRAMLGKIYTYNEKYDNAVKHFGIALNDYPDEATDSLRCVIYPDLGLSYLKLLRCTEAIPVLLKAEQCSPREVSILFNIAAAYELCNKMKEANSYYKKVLAIDPGNKDAKKGEMRTRFQGQQ